ncbi:MAG: hypothetical protein OHK006_08010 [Thermodesulfovibrionales bacterium]
MEKTAVDLKKEQLSSLSRPRHPYSLAARFFFLSMDVLTGRPTTLPKMKLLEMLASIPYRAWEIREYGSLTRNYGRPDVVHEARRIVAWGRDAQDNEYWHLLAVQEKMKAEGLPDPWYLSQPVALTIVWSYRIISWLLAFVSLQRAFLFNAEFEDHAEHVYAEFVRDHPEWETEPVRSSLATEYSRNAATWADVFRRIGLDERDHRNRSFACGGKPEYVVRYEGMPETDDKS